MAKKYFTRYFIKTPNAVGNRKDIENGNIFGWKFNFGSNEIRLYDHKQGLCVDCYIKAESLSNAENKSLILIENILNLINFSTSSASLQLLLITAYDASLNLQEREFKQIFYFPVGERNIVTINKEIFDEVFKVFNQNKDERIVRAISWLGKGYLEQKHVDKFIAFWTGLESINELLGNFFKISDNERKRKCPKCGIDLGPISAGIGKLFTDLKIENFKVIRKARAKLLHGGGPLDDKFLDEIKEYNLTVRRVLIVGIGKLLEIKEGDIDKIIQQKSRLYNETIRFIIKAKLLNFNPFELNEISKQPKIDLIDKNLLNRIIDNQGRTSLKSKMMLKSNANFNDITYEVWADDNTCITSIKIDEIKKVN